MKRIDSARNLLGKHTNIFKCPICNSNMLVLNSNSLKCANNSHSFDLAKQGYVNLLLNAPNNDYDKLMLKSRKIIFDFGFFNPLMDKLIEIIYLHSSSTKIKTSYLLDAGSGEGSQLSYLSTKLNEKISTISVKKLTTTSVKKLTTTSIKELSTTKKNLPNNINRHFQGIGLDISKEGILLGARNFLENLWCVGDLSKLPFQNESLDYIVNILSPSNYNEFKRVIKKDGLIIKVVPSTNYLIELRQAFYEDTLKKEYSNEKVIKHFEKNIELLQTIELNYTINFDKETLKHLIKMTPLSWNAEENKINEFLKKINSTEMPTKSISADFCILIGKGL